MTRDRVGRVPCKFAIVGEADAVLDDRAVQRLAGGDHADVGLGELDDEQALAREFLRGLPEPSRVERDFPDRVRGGEVADVFDAFEDALISVVDRDVGLELLVDPRDRARRASRADIDTQPDRLAFGERGRSRRPLVRGPESGPGAAPGR